MNKNAMAPCAFTGGMRFSTNQLRVLQETLAPPVPHLEAPPELARPAVTQPPQPQLSFLSLSKPAPERTTAVPLAAAPALYGCGLAVLLALALVFPDGWSAGLQLAAVFWAPALALHALSSHHQPAAQAAGLLAACLVAPAAGQPRPEPFAVVACLAAGFFALACPPGQQRLCAGLGLACACAACAACGAAPALARQQQRQLWAAAAACLAAQAGASSWRLVPFELVCAARAR